MVFFFYANPHILYVMRFVLTFFFIPVRSPANTKIAMHSAEKKQKMGIARSKNRLSTVTHCILIEIV